jgi:hypothetical protein
MDWRSDSSGKEPALQALSPEFKAQSHQKRKEKLGIVVHIYNPSYSKNRDSEDQSSKLT